MRNRTHHAGTIKTLGSSLSWSDDSLFVDLAVFSKWTEAEGLRSAMEREGIEGRIVVEGGWLRYFFSLDVSRVRVQVPEHCYAEALKYLHRGEA